MEREMTNTKDVKIVYSDSDATVCPFCGETCTIESVDSGIDWHGCLHLLKAEGLRFLPNRSGFLFFLASP